MAHHHRYRNRPCTTPEQEYAAVMDKIRSFRRLWKKEEDAEYDRFRSVHRTILQKLAHRVIGKGVKLSELKDAPFLDPFKEAEAERIRLSAPSRSYLEFRREILDKVGRRLCFPADIIDPQNGRS